MFLCILVALLSEIIHDDDDDNVRRSDSIPRSRTTRYGQKKFRCLCSESVYTVTTRINISYRCLLFSKAINQVLVYVSVYASGLIV